MDNDDRISRHFWSFSMMKLRNTQRSEEQRPSAEERNSLCQNAELEPRTYLEVFRRALSKSLGGNRLREIRPPFRNENYAVKKASRVGYTKNKIASASEPMNGLFVLSTKGFARFEAYMKNPGEPTEANRRGATLLRTLYNNKNR